jgi:YbbR domain-containing protein
MFWLMSKLAQDYEDVLKISPKLTNSLSAIYSDTADRALSVQIRASGFFILGRKFSESSSFAIDVNEIVGKKQHNGLKIATINLRDKLRDDFDKNVQILSIVPDTIFFSISDHITKKVPVSGDFELSFKNEFRQCAPVQFFPDSVDITGTREQASQIKSIVLGSKKYENLEKTVEDVSTISINPDISVNPKKVKYKIPVERCTEGNVSVSVKTAHLPRGSKLILLPAQVNIRYVVPLKDYNSVSGKDFSVEVDFNDAKKSLNRQVKVKIVRCPPSVFDVKTEPSFVEFLIQK